MSDDMKSGSDVIVSLLTLNWDLPFDARFLSAAQALEAVARSDRETKELTDEQFDERLDKIRSSISDAGLREWTIEKLKHANYVNSRKLLKELYESLNPLSTKWIPKKKAFIDAHLSNRNGFTHRNPNIIHSYSPKALEIDMRASILIGFASIVHHLGFSPEEIEDLMRKSNYKSYWIQSTKSYYSTKKPKQLCN